MKVEQLDNISEICRALLNLIQYQNILNTTDFEMKEKISLFCRLVKACSHQSFETDNEQMINNISEIVLQILGNVSNNFEFASILLSNLHFA
jgi:hypothetical protein